MPPKRKPNTNFPPLEQEALFEHLKKRVSLCRYIDFLKVIRDYHEKENTEDAKKVKAIYTRYVSSLITCYTKEERVLTNNGNNVKEALEKTDLKSEFLINHLKTYLDDADAEGAYYNSAVFNIGEQPPTYSGMTKQDSEVLNRDYILTGNIRSCNTRGKQSKEHRENDMNDQNLQIAENDLHGMQVRLNRCVQLQTRVQYFVEEGQAIAGCSSRRKQSRREFSAVDVAELAQMLRKGKRATEKEIRAEARKVLESLRKDPVHKGPSLLLQIESHRDQLCQSEKAMRLGYRNTMKHGYYNSIVRDTKAIKFRQYPSVTFNSLLDEILDLEAGRRPNPTSFSGRDDDVGMNLSYDGGLLMQFETSRWHFEAFNLISNTRYTAQLQPKIDQFKRVMLSFFALVLSEQGTTRGQAGDFSGVVLFGDELLYTTFRLYHALVTRLHTAFLLAEVAVADTNFRKHTNEIGKPRGQDRSDWDVYLSDSEATEGGWTSKPFPTVEGNAHDKMNAFLRAISKKALANRKDDYSPQNFEMDVIAAVGPQGNQLFTITRILDRLRDSFREMKWEQLDDFERYFQEVESGNCNAAADYQREVSEYEHGWLFKLQCVYADSFKDDEFGSVGEKGDIGRVKVTIVKRGTAPEKKILKRSTAAGSGTRGRKRRKKHFG